MLNYLIECKYYNLVREKILDIKIDNKYEDVSSTYYDLREVSINKVLEDLNTFGLFSSKKIVICDNFNDKSVTEDDYNLLIKYLDNPMDDNILILTCEKIDDRKKIFKTIKSKVNFFKLDININDYIKKKLVDYKLDYGVLNKLVEYSCNDFDKVVNDIEILKSFKIDTKIITVNDIDEILTKKLGDSNDLVFELSKAIASNNKSKALGIYQNLLEYQIEPISIISLIASQFRIMLQVKCLSNYNNNDITAKLGEKSSYRISKTREVINNYSKEDIFSNIKRISEIDLLMKSSDQDNKFLLEMFILNI